MRLNLIQAITSLLSHVDDSIADEVYSVQNQLRMANCFKRLWFSRSKMDPIEWSKVLRTFVELFACGLTIDGKFENLF